MRFRRSEVILGIVLAVSAFHSLGVNSNPGCAFKPQPTRSIPTLPQCQAKLEKVAGKLYAAISKALTKCDDAIRKDQLAGTYLGNAADKCENGLSKVYGLGLSNPAGAAVGKFLASVSTLGSAGTCDTAALTQLGHLVSGINAPGMGLTDFASTWLAKAKEKLAMKRAFFDVGDTRTLLDAVINLAPGIVANGELGTFCGTGTAPAGFLARPNLCQLAPANSPMCRDHACTLASSSAAAVRPAGIPVSFDSRRLALETCTLPTDGSLPVGGGHCNCTGGVSSGTCVQGGICSSNANCGVASTGIPGDCANDFMLVINQPGRIMQPPPVIASSPSETVCIDEIRSEGWCDCVAGGVSAPINPTTCIDHVGTTGSGTNNTECISAGNPAPCCTGPGTGTCAADDCGAPQFDATLESNCVCAAGAPMGSPCTTAGCQTCVDSSAGAPCHSGTKNGRLVTSWGGASTAGSCVILDTFEVKILPAAICFTAGGQAVGICNAPGSPQAPCTMAGGVICVDSRGADGVACTADDLIPTAVPTTVVLTTGTSASTVQDSPQPTQGNCGGTTTTTSMNCVTAADCGGTAPTCSATLVPISFTAGPGSGISCANLESSNLAGWKIVGSFPALDGAGGLGDTVTTFTLQCN